MCIMCFFSSRRRHTRCALVTGVQTCALPISGERAYILEVDSTATFDSPFLKKFSVSAAVLVRQPITLPETDSTVYYWRTRVAVPLDSESKDWTTRDRKSVV